jgi:hypothetical protein
MATNDAEHESPAIEASPALKWIVGGVCVSALICLLYAGHVALGGLDDDRRLGLWVISGAIGLSSSTILFLIVGPRTLVERFRQNS